MRITVSISPTSINDLIVLHSAGRYITWVALENCVEYFGAVECIGSNTKPVIQKGKELFVFRKFLNAIESLNNIPDYLFHENPPTQQSVEDYRKDFYKSYPIVEKVSEIANAYKHCVRGRSKKGTFVPDAGAQNARDILLDHDMIFEALKFWAKYCEEKKLA